MSVGKAGIFNSFQLYSVVTLDIKIDNEGIGGNGPVSFFVSTVGQALPDNKEHFYVRQSLTYLNHKLKTVN